MTYNNNKSTSRNTAPSDTTKPCTSCHQELPLSDFYITRAHNDGLSYTCKSCTKTAVRRNYYSDLEANREKGLLKMRAIRHKQKQALRLTAQRAVA